eukprot:Gb_37267 [translate_table: standard]
MVTFSKDNLPVKVQQIGPDSLADPANSDCCMEANPILWPINYIMDDVETNYLDPSVFLILPVMLSSKLLPEMEAEETSKKEQILAAISNFPVAVQVEKLKSRIEAIGAACDCAEKVIADARKVYGLGSRQNPAIMPQIDKVQAAKIEEQEKLLRAAASSGEGESTFRMSCSVSLLL